MPGELFEIEGEKKKRVVWADLFFLIPPSRIRSLTRLPHTRSAISSTLTLGDFTMAPDIRMSPRS